MPQYRVSRKNVILSPELSPDSIKAGKQEKIFPPKCQKEHYDIITWYLIVYV